MVRNRQNEDKDSENERDEGGEKKPKSRKPPNTAFRQQRLLAYTPLLTPKAVLPLFFAVGIIFGPLGGLLLYASSKVPCFLSLNNVVRYKKSALIIHVVPKSPTTTSQPSRQISFPHPSPRPTPLQIPNLNGEPMWSVLLDSASNKSVKSGLQSRLTLSPQSCYTIVLQIFIRIIGGM